MTRTPLSVVALGLLIACSPLAEADEVLSYQTRTPTEDQTRWVHEFGGPTRRLLEQHRFRMRWSPGDGLGGVAGTVAPGDAERVLLAQGVRARYSDLDVQRMRFRTPEEAMLYAGRQEAEGDGTSLIEVRGDRVLVLSGSGMSDPRFAVSARQIAWRGVSEVGQTPDLLAIRDGDHSVVRSVRSGPYYDALQDALSKTRAKREDMQRPESTMRQVWDGEGSVTVTGPSFTARLREGADGVFGVVGVGDDHAEAVDRLESYLQVVEAESPGPPLSKADVTTQIEPRTGASRRLNDLLGE